MRLKSIIRATLALVAAGACSVAAAQEPPSAQTLPEPPPAQAPQAPTTEAPAAEAEVAAAEGA